MAYRINGPTDIGNTGQQNLIQGDTKLQDAGFAQGTVYYANASGILTGLSPGTLGNVLTTQGAGANPTWASASATSNGFSVGKTAGDTFSNTEVVIGNWNTTTPTGVTLNPFFNTGAPVLTLVSGIFIPDITGVYQIDAHIIYTNTNNSGDRTLTFSERTVGPVYNPIISTGTQQPSSSTGTDQSLRINISIKLDATKEYVLTIVSSNAAGTRTILAPSRFSAMLI